MVEIYQNVHFQYTTDQRPNISHGHAELLPPPGGFAGPAGRALGQHRTCAARGPGGLGLRNWLGLGGGLFALAAPAAAAPLLSVAHDGLFAMP